jgi:hypothetical protein
VRLVAALRAIVKAMESPPAPSGPREFGRNRTIGALHNQSIQRFVIERQFLTRLRSAALVPALCDGFPDLWRTTCCESWHPVLVVFVVAGIRAVGSRVRGWM